MLSEVLYNIHEYSSSTLGSDYTQVIVGSSSFVGSEDSSTTMTPSSRKSSYIIGVAPLLGKVSGCIVSSIINLSVDNRNLVQRYRLFSSNNRKSSGKSGIFEYSIQMVHDRSNH